MSEPNDFTILIPSSRHEAIEERYGAAHSTQRLVQGTGAPVVFYDPAEAASAIAARIATETVVVVTDDTALAPPGLATKLVRLLQRSSADAVIPTAADGPEAAQHAHTVEPYLSLSTSRLLSSRVRVENASVVPRGRCRARSGIRRNRALARVDLLLKGDIRQLVDGTDERFDFIVCGNVVEHVDDPWTCSAISVAFQGPVAAFFPCSTDIFRQ